MSTTPVDHGFGEQWQKLSPLVVLRAVLKDLWQVLVLIGGAVFFQQSGSFNFGIFALLSGIAVSLAVSIANALSVRFRVHDNVLEKRSGVLSREHEKIRLDLIRTVKVERKLADRVLGLASLTVLTGADDDDFQIEGLKSDTAAYIRSAVDQARAPKEQATAPAAHDVAGDYATEMPLEGAPGEALPQPVSPPAPVFQPKVLAKFTPSWVFKGAVTGPGILPVFAAIFALATTFNVWDGDFLDTYIDRAVDAASHSDSWMSGINWQFIAIVSAVTFILLLLPVNYLGNAAFYVYKNFGFTLRQVNDSTLETTSGLTTTTSNSINTERLRGVSMKHSIVQRLVKVASLDAILTVGESAESADARLLPAVPRDMAVRVTDYVLPVAGSLDSPLQRHGPKAFRRMFIGGFLIELIFWVAVCVGVNRFFPPAVPYVIAWTVLVLAWHVVGTVKRYQWLGHALIDGALILRSGWLVTTRKVVSTSMSNGVSLSQGPIQRFLGIGNVSMHTAAGPRELVDVTMDRAAVVMSHIDDDLIAPFRYNAPHQDSPPR